ncbi:hypothetical protein HC028_19465 [Planosporangium flavigriseum]|uniref:Uncharacterized protein n=1 Tax=Planosporangium flavigriseum TaxID=373681 RepID=A0A8J3PP56_9ACTN|nr:hypothetical protein [Planosporangium flavigriseum]NJC66668.1 hypothetical protein [Planosporangium flavigriseum]GIG76697.1 hypothetical protein Pfl04_51010 [Planosporangium flavigriseum]
MPWWLLLGALIGLNADNVTWYWYVFGAGRSTGDGTIAGVFASLVTPLVMLRSWRIASERSWAEWALRYQAHHDATRPNRPGPTRPGSEWSRPERPTWSLDSIPRMPIR